MTTPMLEGFSLTPPPEHPLPLRDEAVVDAFFATNGNKAQAYALAGFTGGRHNAARFFKKKRVQQAIQARLASRICLGDEALARLSLVARFDIRKLFPDNKQIANLPDEVALCVKAIWPTKFGYRIELHDAQRANEILAKADGRLKETVHVEHSLEYIMARANQLTEGSER